MDSTGEKEKIEVCEHVAIAFKDKYKFEFREEIDVKGKSRMKNLFSRSKFKNRKIISFLNFRIK